MHIIHREVLLWTYPQSPSLCEPAMPSEASGAAAGAMGVSCCQAGISICCVLPDHVCCIKTQPNKTKVQITSPNSKQLRQQLVITKAKVHGMQNRLTLITSGKYKLTYDLYLS